jgi:serine/threonine-protein kinase
LVGQTLQGFQLLALLDAGGMAEVYRGRDVALDREVAVKVLPAALATDAGYVARFRDEARRVAALAHPNIVPVYHFGEERGLLFLVMPILKESLRDWMGQESLPHPEDSIRIAAQVAAALEAAHAQGLVHRDVKPENILLDADGKALLTDFGIAREVASLRETGNARTLASTGLPVGTPEYMAPEQLRAGDVDQRADIYGLGAVLYELLTGHVPHEAATPYEVAALVLMAELAPPSTHNPDVWPELDRVVIKALARDAGERYPDAHAFSHALSQAILHRDTAPVSTVLVAGPLIASAMARDVPTAPDAMAAPGELWPMPRKVKTGPGQRRARLLVSAALAALLIGVCSGGGLLFNGGFLLQLGGVATSSPSASNMVDTAGTATVAATATNNRHSATPGAGATSTPRAHPSPNATIVPRPSPTLPPSLALKPQPLALYGGGTCWGVQTITNKGTHTVGWQWQAAGLPAGLRFGLNGHDVTSPPSDTTPGIAPGGHDTLVVSTSNCNGQTYSITVVDTMQATYSFKLVVAGGR